MKQLHLLRILERLTDEDHDITMAQIIEALAELGCKAERKSVYDDLALLKGFGIDIEMRRSRSFGYYLASRQFELPELKLLVDAVQSSRFITQKKSRELIDKLAGLTSVHLASQLQRQVYVADRPKAQNESIYYNIDGIHNAINANRKINFKYFDYDLGKKRAYRKRGDAYTMTPMALCWDDDKYYLVCFNAKYDDFTSFRVDRMSGLTVSDDPADRIDRKRHDVAKFIKQRFGMYSGPVALARLRFDSELVNVALDRFGANVRLEPDGDGFIVEAEVAMSPVFLGWMAGLGDKAEVLAPASLREAMAELAGQLAAKYGG
jgi:predicted DNA-binding transcriptional regulator YafY